MILIYWSAVARLRNKPEQTVPPTTLTVFFINRTKIEVILPNIPLAVIAPPKHMAHRMSQIVFSIPDMPRVAIKSDRTALSVCRLVLPYIVIINPLNNESKPEVAIPETSCNNSGWKIKAKTPASSVDKNRVMMEGILRAINMPVAIGTIKSQGVMWNFSFKAVATSVICCVLLASCENPATVKIIKVIMREGTVVIIMYRICRNSGVSVTEAANMVVSDRGETLSPK